MGSAEPTMTSYICQAAKGEHKHRPHSTPTKQSEELKQDFIEVFNCVDKPEAQFFIRGPPPRGDRAVSRSDIRQVRSGIKLPSDSRVGYLHPNQEYSG